MNDQEFTELRLRATIVPQQSSWPAPDYVHWQKLHAAADEARQRVSGAFSIMDEIDKDPDLSPEGKERKKKKAAAEAIADFQNSKMVSNAKEAVERQRAKWAEKTGVASKAPTNFAEAMVHAEIRAHLAAMKGGKLGLVEQHISDPRVASAVLGAPSFLRGLTDTEIAIVHKKAEQHVAPKIAEARDATLKSMEEAEKGWQRAKDKIGERAGLTKGPDGVWCDPKVSKPATA